MKELIDKLHAGDCSLVLLHDGKINTYENRGVRDLWALLNEKPELLYESKVADKTVERLPPHSWQQAVCARYTPM